MVRWIDVSGLAPNETYISSGLSAWHQYRAGCKSFALDKSKTDKLPVPGSIPGRPDIPDILLPPELPVIRGHNKADSQSRFYCVPLHWRMIMSIKRRMNNVREYRAPEPTFETGRAPHVQRSKRVNTRSRYATQGRSNIALPVSARMVSTRVEIKTK
jgi:hypothetical protein